MKKILLAVLFVSLLAVSAYAEIGAQTYSVIPRFDEMTVFVHAYNPSASDIASNSVVVLTSTDAANMTYKATGAVIATTTSQDSVRVFGITDGVVPAYGNGKVCIRGPHRVLANVVGGSLVAGASMSTTTTAGYMTPLAAQSQGPAVKAYLLSTAADPTIASGVIQDNANLYWVELI